MFDFGINELAIICCLSAVLVFLPLAIVLAGRRRR
jgi:hypothetical protein